VEKILVTGASGFLGSWVLKTLQIQGYSVLGLTRKNSNLWRISNISSIRVIRKDEADWGSVIRDEKPSIVIALDWNGVDNKSHDTEVQLTNISRALAIAQSCLESGVKTFIGFGSQAEIGPTKGMILEDTNGNPTTNYGKAKVELRKKLFVLFDKTQIDFKWVRIFSTYGPLDTTQWFIPLAVHDLVNKKNFNMTFGEQSWNYLHAYDFANGVCTLIKSEKISGIINIGNNQQITILEVSKIIGEYLGLSQAIKVGAVPYRDDQVMTLHPDVTKMESLGWQPSIPLKTGIETTIDWILGKKNIKIVDVKGSRLLFNLPAKP
jgi:UDP-glucose 4-epimerase